MKNDRSGSSSSDTERRSAEKEEGPPGMVNEALVLQVEFEMRKENLRQAEVEATALLENYRDLYDYSPVVHFTVDTGGLIRETNLSGSYLMGVPREGLVGRSLAHFFAPGTRPAFEAFLAALRAGRQGLSCDVSLLREGGGAVQLQAKGIAFTPVSECRIALVDVTDRWRAEEALRESEANFRTFFEVLTDLVMVGTPDGRTLFTNAAVTRTLGYTPEELKGMALLDLHPPDKRLEAERIFAAMFKGERETCPLPLARKDGSLVPVETRVWFGRWSGADCIFGISKDLTAETEAQQRFERLFRNNPAPMALSTLPDRRFSDVNEAFLKVFGFTRGDLIGKTSPELGLFADEKEQAAVARILLEAGRVSDHELQVRRKDGALLDGLFSGEVISSQGRQHFLTVMIDITGRKRAEEELRQERWRLQSIIEGTHVGTWEWNVQSGETVFNEEWAQIVGHTLDELAPVSIETWTRLAHPGDLALSAGLLERHFTGELPYYDFECRMKHRDGRWVWVHDRGRVITRTADGKPLMMFGTHADITGRKNVEEALRRSEGGSTSTASPGAGRTAV